MTQRKDGGVLKSSRSASACRTSENRSEDTRRDVPAKETIKAAIFWPFGLLRKRFYGEYSRRDVANVLALAAASEISTGKVCSNHEPKWFGCSPVPHPLAKMLARIDARNSSCTIVRMRRDERKGTIRHEP